MFSQPKDHHSKIVSHKSSALNQNAISCDIYDPPAIYIRLQPGRHACVPRQPRASEEL